MLGNWATGKIKDGERAHQHHDDGNDHGDDGAVDEEL